jgi:exodeoxyribonuclease-3
LGTGHKTSDDEGRVIQLDFGDLRLINAYFPSGTTGEERQSFKYRWLDEFFAYLEGLKKKRPNLILCGDYNIAHKEIDIHDPKGNKNSSGFLPDERAWMDKFIENGWIDTFRHLNPEPHRYSWWSQRFPSVRQQNKGWRIDYINVTSPLKEHLVSADIYHDVRQSDHCPVYLEIRR